MSGTHIASAAPMTVQELWRLMRQALSAWVDDYAPSMGAALSYYTLFSIAPLLMIVIAGACTSAGMTCG